MFDYSATRHRIIRWQPDVTSASIVVLCFVKVPDIFILHNTTNKCTYVKCVYRMLNHNQHLSNHLAVIVMVFYRITRVQKKLLKCISELLTVKNMAHTSYTIIEFQVTKY